MQPFLRLQGNGRFAPRKGNFTPLSLSPRGTTSSQPHSPRGRGKPASLAHSPALSPELDKTDSQHPEPQSQGSDTAQLWPNLLVTSHTPQRRRFMVFSLSSSLSFFSICSEKKVSKIRYTSLVVVALVGPLSLSILVGCRMACLLAARLERRAAQTLSSAAGSHTGGITPSRHRPGQKNSGYVQRH